MKIDELIEKYKERVVKLTEDIKFAICPNAFVPIGKKLAFEEVIQDLEQLKREME